MVAPSFEPAAPAWVVGLGGHAVDHVGPAGGGQRIDQVLGAENARVEVAVLRLNHCDELAQDLGSLLRRDEAVVQGAAHRRLGAAGVEAGLGIVELLVEGLPNGRGQVAVLLGVVGLAEQGGGLGDDQGVAIIVAGRGDLLRRLGLGGGPVAQADGDDAVLGPCW